MILLALSLAAAAAPCKTLDTNLPRDLSGWTRAGHTLDTGHAVTLPDNNHVSETRITIRKEGIFGIAADQGAWIDVYPLGRGRAFDMASESKGPYCSTIEKIVRYRLKPGTYRVVVTRVKGPDVKLMLVHSGASNSRTGNHHEVLRRYRRHR